MTKEKVKEIIDLLYASNYEEASRIMEEEREKDDGLNTKAALFFLCHIMNFSKTIKLDALLDSKQDVNLNLSSEEVKKLEDYIKVLYVSMNPAFEKYDYIDENYNEEEKLFIQSFRANDEHDSKFVFQRTKELFGDKDWRTANAYFEYLCICGNKKAKEAEEYIETVKESLGEDSPYLIKLYLDFCYFFEFDDDSKAYDAAYKAYLISLKNYNKESRAHIYSLLTMLKNSNENESKVVDELKSIAFELDDSEKKVLIYLFLAIHYDGSKEYLEMAIDEAMKERQLFLSFLSTSMPLFKSEKEFNKIIIIKTFKLYQKECGEDTSEAYFSFLNTAELFKFNLAPNLDVLKDIISETTEGTALYYSAKINYANFLFLAKRYDESFDYFKELSTEIENFSGKEEADIASIKYRLSDLYKELGNTARSERLLKEAAVIYDEIGIDIPISIEARKKYAISLYEKENMEEALKFFNSAYEKYGEEKEKDDDYAEICHYLGRIYDTMKEDQKSYDYFKNAYEYYLKERGEDDEDTIIDRSWCASKLNSLARYEEAYDLAKENYTLEKKRFGEDDETLLSLFIAAQASFYLRDYKRALKDALYVLKGLKKLDEIPDDAIPSVANFAISAAIMQGNKTKALEIAVAYNIDIRNDATT